MIKAAGLSLLFAVAACGATLGSPDGGTGGAGGASACEAAVAVDRTCAVAADCVAVAHTSNCCGQTVFIGIRASEQTRYQALESQCDASYPACGCAASEPTTDDGSHVRFDGTAGVACVQGRCITFVPECGAPCAAGTMCFSCANPASVFAACTTPCTASSDCHDPALPLCQSSSSGNTFGMYCTPANVACDTR